MLELSELNSVLQFLAICKLLANLEAKIWPAAVGTRSGKTNEWNELAESALSLNHNFLLYRLTFKNLSSNCKKIITNFRWIRPLLNNTRYISAYICTAHQRFAKFHTHFPFTEIYPYLVCVNKIIQKLKKKKYSIIITNKWTFRPRNRWNKQKLSLNLFMLLTTTNTIIHVYVFVYWILLKIFLRNVLKIRRKKSYYYVFVKILYDILP